MSDTMVMPPRIHWPNPADSWTLNGAMSSFPLTTDSNMLKTASTLSPGLLALSLMTCYPLQESCCMVVFRSAPDLDTQLGAP